MGEHRGQEEGIRCVGGSFEEYIVHEHGGGV